MNIQLLQVFLTTAREGSISKAAQTLNYAQSNVTNKIQQLENDLQTTLFYRHSRGITLTPSGQILVSYSEKILHTIEEARAAMGESSAPSGPLRIGSMETTAAVWLPQLLAHYHNLYPNVDFNLVTGPTEQQIQAVLHYELDGAFISGPIEHPDLVQEKILDEELVLVTSASHPEISSIQDVQTQTMLVLREGCSYRAKLNHILQEEGLLPLKLMEFGILEAIIGCVSAGLGISLLPRSIIASHEKQGRIRSHTISDKYSLVSTMFIRRKDTFITPALTAFLTNMRDHFQKNIG
ncbi:MULTISPECIES: glutamate biosynthesis transcriptional regulator GltR [Bacillus]|uniref:glutamate biosynthesis transcriptional regulator GltR n=1 Tax=Bacillus TaxID=1386 RepID=UPI0002597E30|nr:MULTISPECIES: glutamate biosynthesis transcriptional regulator GltR [unclassified Bacillus (in: firmicutes)]AFI29188.1 LysR family transcriptional regulator [Bacillus sp. JS]PTU28475.1 LysR family transcriptional regulator [Bacillus subtilis]GFM15089.1 LysR family transcriptional regulator [Bacillus sp. FW1]